MAEWGKPVNINTASASAIATTTVAAAATATGPDPGPDDDLFVVVDEGEVGDLSSLLVSPATAKAAGEMEREMETVGGGGKDDQQSKPMAKVVTSRACLMCRKLKMKCTIEAGPSCARCIKSGRHCEFPQPGQALPSQPRRRPRPRPKPEDQLQEIEIHDRTSSTVHVHVPSSTSTSTAAAVITSHPDHAGTGMNHIRHVNHHHGSVVSNSNVSYNTPSWTAITPESSTRGATKKKASDLPSAGYSASPLAATVGDIGSRDRQVSGNNAIRHNEQPPVKRRRTAGQTLGAQDGDEESISRRDMEQLLELFKERILSFIPILGPEDFEDIPTMLTEQKPLVQCVCYVTARFVPGGNAIRDKLFRSISDLLLGLSETQRSTSTALESLALFKGLIVLYAYAQAAPAAMAIEGSQAQAPAKDLLYWRIKTFTEAHALQLFIHRSIEGLRAAIAAEEPQISNSYCYKMYTYWLWLYIMSHRGSRATRTPPSIRADASIRAASKLLNEIGMNARISRLLSEVKLCLSWEQASIHESELGEWWCQPEPRPSPDPSRRDLIDEAQATLNRWTHRWRDQFASGMADNHQASGLDFHIRFTQFCITTYTLRPFQPSSYGIGVSESDSDSLLPAQKAAIAECLQAATHVLLWALDLGPVSKDHLRYLGDFGFVMLSFCSFFILQASRAFSFDFRRPATSTGIIARDSVADADADEYVNTVQEAAELMIELAMDSKHAPAVYGNSILLLLKKVRDPTLRQSQNNSSRLGDAGGGNHHNNIIASLSSSQDSLRPRSRKSWDTTGRELSSAFVPDLEQMAWDFTSLFPDMLWT